jgi:hypothetical protein
MSTVISVLVSFNPSDILCMHVLLRIKSGRTLLDFSLVLLFLSPMPCIHGLLVAVLIWGAPMGINYKPVMP